MTTHLSLAFWIASYLLSAIAIVLALTKRRGFAGTLAWVLAIVAFPGAGALAYLLLANPSVRRTRSQKQLAAEEVRRALGAAHPGGQGGELLLPAGASGAGGAAAALVPAAAAEPSVLRLATRLSGFPARPGNELELLTDNSSTFARIERALREARHSIWAEYYIINDDETGRRFLDLLAARARDGVDVRLLYDAVGSSGIDTERLGAIATAGGRTEAFLPPNPLRRRWSVHLRNHRKILVVDGEVGFTGGMNIGDEYSGGYRRRRLRLARAWRDTHLGLRGPAVRDLAQIFAEDWLFAADEVLPLQPPVVAQADQGSTVVILPSGPDQETNATGLTYFAAIASAQSRCYLTSPYFVPDEATVRALVSAALRGVDVRLLVPERNDLLLMRTAIRSNYPTLVEAGVRVYEYRPAMLHAKTMVVDGAWSLIGSANLDVRSFRLNFETSALVFDPAFARVMEQQYHADLVQSTEITADSLAARGFWARLGEGAVGLLSPLL